MTTDAQRVAGRGRDDGDTRVRVLSRGTGYDTGPVFIPVSEAAGELVPAGVLVCNIAIVGEGAGSPVTVSRYF